MRKVELCIDDTIFERFMGLVEMLPSDKIDVYSIKKEEKKESEILQSHNELNELLEREHLSHFKYFKENSKIVYTKSSGTSRHIEDYKRLVVVLEANNVKFTAVGVDVLLIET